MSLRNRGIDKGSLTKEQGSAIRYAELVTETILAEHRKIIGTIVGRRIRGESYAAIAENERKTLQKLGAMTHEVRKHVIGNVCNAVLRPEFAQKITIDVLAQRPLPSNLTDDARRRAREAVQIHQWTDDIDKTIATLAESVRRTTPPNVGEPDWKEISRRLNQLYGLDFTKAQWKGRYTTIRTKQKKDIATTATASTFDVNDKE